jgi:uncharacterized membrane protein (UPF0127 family)
VQPQSQPSLHMHPDEQPHRHRPPHSHPAPAPWFAISLPLIPCGVSAHFIYIINRGVYIHCMASPAKFIVVAALVLIFSTAIYYYVRIPENRSAYVNFSYANVSLGDGRVNGTYWIANTLSAQEYGYMNASSPEVLGNGERCTICKGMLFEFGYNQDICMWMKNTRMRLLLRWFYLNGSLSYERIGIPYNTTQYCAYAAYVIETEAT